MKCVFVSNYLTHHQISFCEQVYKMTNGDFRFVCYEPMSEERIAMNWSVEKKEYEIRAYENAEQYNLAEEWVQNADVAIISGEPKGFLNTRKRLKDGKLTFRFSERLFKKKYSFKNLFRVVKHFLRNFGYKNLYLLSASAYAPLDFSKIGLFKNKMFKWGYFPETTYYNDIGSLVSEKEENSLIWVARFIDWKHPEVPVLVAKKLKEAGYKFNLNMIGKGYRFEEIEELIKDSNLTDCINLLGIKTPQEVRNYMEKSKIFLFTSDSGEGWGAVLNESMNSGCAPIASHVIGSTPFLIDDGVNGYLYKDGDIDDLFCKIKILLEKDKRCSDMGINAYRTITEQWCAENAAKRFLNLCNALLDGEDGTLLFQNGVMSKAEILPENWYK